MFAVEPPPSQGDVHFSLLGYPVRIHPLFWLVAIFMGLNLQDPVLVGIWVVAMLVCILLHELGHAVLMQTYGYAPSIVLYSFGGLAIPHAGRQGIRRPGPWGQMLIAFAGPASGFLLALVLALPVYYLSIHHPHDYAFGFYFRVVPDVIVPNKFLTEFLHDVLQISVIWGLLNLLPIFPLDGGQIARQVFELNNPQDALRQSLILSVIVGGLMIAITLIQWKDFYLALLFGYMTYSNFMTLQSLQVRGGW